jgi:four helix bundle protein
MVLAESAHRLTAKLPRRGAQPLADQMWRSAISVPANIAEGYGRESAGSYVQFLKVARGSLNELETQILLAQRLELVAQADVSPLLASTEGVSKMLNGLIRSIQAKRAPG